MRRILLHGKDIARQRQDHALLDQLTTLYTRIPYVRVPSHLYAEAERLAWFRPPKPRQVSWWPLLDRLRGR